MNEFPHINESGTKPDLGSLILKYKGIGNIPDVELAAVGYHRDVHGRVDKKYSDEEIARTMNDLLAVGPSKSLGYLPTDTINGCGRNVEEITKELEDKGLHTILLNPKEAGKTASVLYAYDQEALSALLKNNQNILDEAGWPSDPESFIRKLKTLAERGSPLFKLSGVCT